MARRRRFGRVRQLPSGRWQARYAGPDGLDRAAPETFTRKADADRWLAAKEAEIVGGDWLDPDAGRVPLGPFATSWVEERAGLRPKTRQLYEGLVRLHIVPTLGSAVLTEISPGRVRSWRSGLLAAGTSEVTTAKAYRLLRTILATAVDDRLIKVNPCQIKGASTERSPERPVLTVDEVYALAVAMPPRYRALVLLGMFCSLRFGELAALQRGDVDLDLGVIHVRHGVVEMKTGQLLRDAPKTKAGRRVIGIPGAVIPEARQHLALFVGPERSAGIFVGPKGGPLRRSNFQKHWTAALKKAGISGVHFHDLRHTGNTLTAQSGATVPDLMARMGHASARAAIIYLHTTSARDRVIADRLSELVPEAHRARSGHDEAEAEGA